jgi:cytochrome P450
MNGEPIVVEEFDPFRRDVQQSPHAWYEAMRSAGSVHLNPTTDSWFVVSRIAVKEALSHPEVFSSRTELVLRTPENPEVSDEAARIRSEGWPEEPVLARADPPQHDRQRAMFIKAFTSRRVRELEPDVHRLADTLIEDLVSERVVDFVARFAVPFPIQVIARILNIPLERSVDIKRWSDARAANIGSRLPPAAELRRLRDEVDRQKYFAAQFEERRSRPRDDLLSAMASAMSGASEVEGETLTMAESLAILGQLLAAGNETTTKLLSSTMHCLAQNRDLWDWLRDDPSSRIPGFIEEALRLFPPVQGLPRITTCDTELEGVLIPKGATVFLMFASANRDADAFKDPDVLDPERPNAREHLAFGHGIHYCLGAALARMEVSCALSTLLQRVEHPTLCRKNDYAYEPSFIMRGLEALHVEFRLR